MLSLDRCDTVRRVASDFVPTQTTSNVPPSKNKESPAEGEASHARQVALPPH
jgi:hypothetical protein